MELVATQELVRTQQSVNKPAQSVDVRIILSRTLLTTSDGHESPSKRTCNNVEKRQTFRVRTSNCPKVVY